MLTVSPALTLDSIATDETITPGARHERADVVGYVVARTMFGHGRIEDVDVFGVDRYGSALECMRDERTNAPAGHYARLDVLYSNGDRIIA